MNDSIVEEVRKYRDEHAKRFNYDLDAICADLMKHQVSRSNRLIKKRKNANKITSADGVPPSMSSSVLKQQKTPPAKG